MGVVSMKSSCEAGCGLTLSHAWIMLGSFQHYVFGAIFVAGAIFGEVGVLLPLLCAQYSCEDES